MSFRILSQDCRISNESYLTGLNNNDLIVGPSGADKTRGYVLPNILQCNESLIVADTKNTLRAETEAVLRQNGYQVYTLDLTGTGPSSGYDPLDYIRLDPQTNRYSEQDIMAVAAALAPIESPQEPFWEFSARIYLESIIGYVLECLPEEEHTMDMVVRLSRELGTGRLAKLMDGLELLDPDSFAVRRYIICRDGERADKTNACVLMFLAEKLAPLDYEGAKAMFHNPEKIHMARLGREKTACSWASATQTAPWTGWRTCSMRRPCTSCVMKRTAAPATGWTSLCALSWTTLPPTPSSRTLTRFSPSSAPGTSPPA